MANPSTPTPLPDPATDDAGDDDAIPEQSPVCVMCFNANDPSGAAGLGADITALASVGTHALAVVTGAYARDSAEIFDHFAFDDEAVSEQARAVLEDMHVEVFKVGFVGSPENLAAIAEVAADYSEVPLVAYMPNLSWWAESSIETYHDAFKELMLPQTTVLVGNHSTLWRWLLPEWASERPPTARDIARAASELGVPYTMVTGIPGAEQHIENTVASAQSILTSQHFERFEAVFSGAGETLSAALAGLLATGEDLPTAANEALLYLDRALNAGFRPGMGHVLPDRLFWAQPDDDDDDAAPDAGQTLLDLPTPDTKH
jgi:hydroxymethylpyrimidine/phosphomethylpyrimidine kinase